MKDMFRKGYFGTPSGVAVLKKVATPRGFLYTVLLLSLAIAAMGRGCIHRRHMPGPEGRTVLQWVMQ